MSVIKTSLAGARFKNPDGSSRQDLLDVIYMEYWTEGRDDEVKLELRAEPDNPHDPNAVAVWATRPERVRGQIGYVQAKHAQEVVEALHADKVSSVTLDHMGVRGRGAKVWAKLNLTIGESVSDDDIREYGLIEDSEGRVYEFGD